jgi:hypothetical protein
MKPAHYTVDVTALLLPPNYGRAAELFLAYLSQVLQPSCFHLAMAVQPSCLLPTYHRCYSLAASAYLTKNHAAEPLLILQTTSATG